MKVSEATEAKAKVEARLNSENILGHDAGELHFFLLIYAMQNENIKDPSTSKKDRYFLIVNSYDLSSQLDEYRKLQASRAAWALASEEAARRLRRTGSKWWWWYWLDGWMDGLIDEIFRCSNLDSGCDFCFQKSQASLHVSDRFAAWRNFPENSSSSYLLMQAHFSFHEFPVEIS